MPLTALAFWAVYVAGTCAALVYPVIGVGLYVLVYHVHPETQWWGASFEASGLRPSLTVAIAVVAGMLLRRAHFAEGAKLWRPPIVLLLALAGYALLTLTWADPSWGRTPAMADKVLKLAVFVVILVRCVSAANQYQFVFMSWLLGVVYIGYEAWGNVGYRVGGRLNAGLGGPDFAESSGLSAHLVASLPLAGALFFMARNWWGRGFALLAGALAVNTIIMTRTRNALAGLLAMCLCTVFWLPRGYRLKGLAALVAGVVLSAQLTDPGWWERMRTIADYQRDSSVQGRLVYWRAALDLAAQNPFGIGLGQFYLRVQQYTPNDPIQHSAHSTFAACLAEFGIPGSVLLGLIILGTIGGLSRIRRAAYTLPPALPIELGPWRSRFHLGWHALALQTALVGYLGCALFTTRLWAEDFWMLLGLAVCLKNVHCGLAAEAGAATLRSGAADKEPRGAPDQEQPAAAPEPT